MIEKLFEKLGYIKKNKHIPLNDLVRFCERNIDYYDEEEYSKDANKFHNAALTFTKYWVEKTYGTVCGFAMAAIVVT